VPITDTLLERKFAIDLAAVRRHRHAAGLAADSNRGTHPIRRRIDHRHIVDVLIRDIDCAAFPG
jgi:hypothetical protein